ncbi:MAG TPA: hypothetical protein VG013_26415 [Gemmataceae bacterium]|nr:hypothetical protein [Gemmataceae bacterium]
MKRLLSILAAGLLLAGLGLGCGNSSKNKGINSGKDLPKPEKNG